MDDLCCIDNADIFGCVPVEKSWHFRMVGKRLDRRARDTFNASFNLIMDVFIFVLWKLQMSGSRKCGVAVVFSVGLLSVGTIAYYLFEETEELTYALI
jgi:hypothetical protein